MESILKSSDTFRYQMLSRMKSDCEYYLGNGNRSKKCLWSGDEKQQIFNMKLLYNSFSDEDKPEWLTMEDIREYAKRMSL